MAFVHLHVHTHYSLLESVIKPKDLIARTKEFGMPAVAVTDLGNMYGAVEFYLTAVEAQVKPILGAEIYYVTGSRLDKTSPAKKVQYNQSEDQKLFRLVLLCKDATGYKNLCQILTRGFTEGLLVKPRVDFEILEQYKEGLIALTSGLKGEAGFFVAHSKADKARAAVKKLMNVYKDDLYLEIQENGLPEQGELNRFMQDMGKTHGVPLVATAEAYYLKSEQAIAQEVLMCIGAGRTLNEKKDSRLVPDTFYLKDEPTMRREFAWAPQAVDNTLLIAEKCNYSFQLKDDKGQPLCHLPDFRPEGIGKNDSFDTETCLRKMTKDGLAARFQEPVSQVYADRLRDELDMIIKTGFAGYFLVVADFVWWAKKNQIPVGPGRGSGAGSLVAFALKITDIDPIPFNLLFERFINPERVSLPDFDIDFCQNRRQEVINYVISKYGSDYVSQIATFGKLLAKGVLRDVSRVLGYSFSEVDPVSKLIPEELGITLEDAIKKEPKIKELIDRDAKWAKVFEIARLLEGLNRQAGMHAAGVVITNRPLVEYCPLFTGKENETIIAYDKDFAEKIGLVKFDFLGLKTLTVIDNAVKFIHANNENFRLDSLNYKDSEVYRLIASGDTDGVFQFESSGMKDLCQRVVPGNLEDITAINALYRPGPLKSGMVDDFINRKHGRTEVRYDLPQLKDILEETYGVIVYQEQVMQVARVLADYSLGEADILRRAMGKKKPAEMAKQKEKFVAGCEKNSIPGETANKIFDLLAKFAEYGFNKSHSAAYSVLSYQTAFLKRYYPAQFMAAMLATEIHDTDKLAHYIADAKSHGLDVLPPDVNFSRKTFSVEESTAKSTTATTGKKPGIRFGLEAIKGVGAIAVDVIIKERDEKGLFKDFIDFCERVKKVNKRVVESLIGSGAFDSVTQGYNRATLFESVENVMSHAAKVQEQSDLGQISFFDQYKSDKFKLDASATSHLYTPVPDWSDSKKLQLEKQLAGFYVSGHPMEKWRVLAKDFLTGDLHAIALAFSEKLAMKKERAQKKPQKNQLSVKTGSLGKGGWVRDEAEQWSVVVAAVVSSTREIITKKGTKMAFVELEDGRSKIEAICFPDVYEKFGPLIKQSALECLPFIFHGNISLEEENAKVFIKSMSPISDLQKKIVSSVIFKLNPSKVNQDLLALLRAVIGRHRGKCATYVEYSGELSGESFSSRHILPDELHVNPTAEFALEVNTIFGQEVVKFM